MKSLGKEQLASGDSAWAVNSGYKLLDVFQNSWTNSDEGFEVELPVRRPVLDLRPTGGQLFRLASRTTTQPTARFRLDTGAVLTLVSRSLAEHLRLDLSNREFKNVPVLGGGEFWCTRTEIEIQLGQWISMTCYVPSRKYKASHENLLGMKGLLAGHFFGLDRRELHLFACQ